MWRVRTPSCARCTPWDRIADVAPTGEGARGYHVVRQVGYHSVFGMVPLETNVSTLNSFDARWNENVRRDWIAAASGWRDQDPRFANMLAVMVTTLTDAARLTPGMRVLDVASGPGASPIALATEVGPSGHVIATDVLPDMMRLIEDQVAEAGLDNVTIQAADAEALPFPDATFDAVTCHIGVMYFANVVKAFREMRRVLGHGRQLTVTSWAPEHENPYFSSLIEPFWKVMDVPLPDPSTPSIFRLGSPGALTARLEEAGFERVREERRTVLLPFPGSAEEYFSLASPRSPTYQRLASRLTSEQRSHVVDDIITGIRQYQTNDVINMPAAIVVATGQRQEL
jgi:SAM-dependent methyltransferase